MATGLVVVVAGGGWWFISQQTAVTPNVPLVSEVQTVPEIPAEVTVPTATTSATTPETPVAQTPTTPTTPAVSAPTTITVKYNGSSFTPASLSVAKGDTVSFINENGGRMWVGADEHPGHVEYDQTDKTTHCAAGYSGPKPFDQCGTGDSYSFTFNKVGVFDYHNHAAAQIGGTITVR